MTIPIPSTQGAKHRRIRVLYAALLIAGAVAVAFCLGFMSGTAASSTAHPTATTSTAKLTYTPTPPTISDIQITVIPSPKPPPPGAVTFEDGTHRIGADVKAGTYRSLVPSDSYNCYWERVRSFDGTSAAIIANGNVDTGRTAIVTLKTSDAGFISQGCGTWIRIG